MWINVISNNVHRTMTIRLQMLQNALARTITRFPHSVSISQLLSDLHWLPIHKWINFKAATLTCKMLSTQQPAYLSNLISWHQSSHSLHSCRQFFLHVNRIQTDFGHRAFSSAAPPNMEPYIYCYLSPTITWLLQSMNQPINQSINHAAGDVPYVSLKKQITGTDKTSPQNPLLCLVITLTTQQLPRSFDLILFNFGASTIFTLHYNDSTPSHLLSECQKLQKSSSTFHISSTVQFTWPVNKYCFFTV